MNKELLLTLLRRAVKSMGTYEPNECVVFIEEDLDYEEAMVARDFLRWCVDNEKTFGWNIAEVFAEYEEQREEAPALERVKQICPDGRMKYIVVIPNYWGKADSVHQALEKCRKESGLFKRDFRKQPTSLYICADKDAYIHASGAICWRPDKLLIGPIRLVAKED